MPLGQGMMIVVRINKATTTSFSSPPSGSGYTTSFPPLDLFVQISNTTATVNQGLVALWYSFSSTNTPPNNFTGVADGYWSLVPQGLNGLVLTNPYSVDPSTGSIDFNFTDFPNSLFENAGTYYFVAVYAANTNFNGSESNPVGVLAYNIVMTAS
jgi:hypothetical protein